MYSIGIAYLLWLIGGCGMFGLHRFYLGKIPTGILWACTGGLGLIGSIYDFFTLPRQVREANIREAIFEASRLHSHHYRGERRVEDGITTPTNRQETPERAILRVAKENKGVVSPTDIALAGNMTLDEAKKNLDALVSKGYAELRVRKSGTIVYTLPEMMDTSTELEDF
ncbi:MAG: TM2 domain-containing protein [Treponema sp.]|jgi:TM2 domain-containing membrane protein YozV|nr:TM2 domain-containing protein [Treponema sp.]